MCELIAIFTSEILRWLEDGGGIVPNAFPEKKGEVLC